VIALEPGLVQKGAGGVPVGRELVDYRLTYLEAPLTLGRAFPIDGGRWTVTPYAGLTLARLSDCGLRFQGQSRYRACGAARPGGEAEPFEPSVPVGVALRRRDPGGSRLVADLRYAHALSPVLEPGEAAARTRTLQARLGFTLPLGAASPDGAGRSEPPAFCCGERRFGLAAGELLVLQAVPWYFNRHFADDSTAVLSTDSWWRNVESGFVWDADNFRTNLFMHPFHGSTYFNAARSNGYDFWESAAFPWIGSFLFEFFGENNPPSINDWASTSASGVVIGEGLFRTARALRDNTATGGERTLRELAALVLDPVGGVNRLLRGEATRTGPNPPDRLPGRVGLDTKLGFRVVGDGRLAIGAGGAVPFLEFAVQYGDPFSELRAPFDDFLLITQLNGREKEVLGRLQIEGPLYRRELARTGGTRHWFGLGLHYDYINNETYELGGQSVSAGILSELRLSDAWTLRGRAQVLGTLIAGVDSEYAGETGRSYDLGSGVGFRAYGALYRGRDRLIEAFYVGALIHTLSGASGNHVIHFPDITARIPLIRPLGLGVEFLFAARNSYYRDFPDVHREDPQCRLFATLMP